ncbi:MAG: hypothetical protein IPO31_04240 [Candidatus Obscuribacter sp.]|nr:hypothetical protein [Candidatus Obscuribacter sp.]
MRRSTGSAGKNHLKVPASGLSIRAIKFERNYISYDLIFDSRMMYARQKLMGASH